MLESERLDEHAERIAKDGYTVLEDVIAPDFLDALAADLERLEQSLDVRPAKNEFEGKHTYRVYNLLAHGKLWERVPVDDTVLPLVERVLDHGCLVSTLSSIGIDPGETEQPIHADDQLMPLAKPHVATVCNTMWALTDFTEANGATRVVPGSHLRDSSPNFGQHYETVPAEMRRGSVLVWHGSLWHGGGANCTTERRIGVAMNYCAGFIRQQENQQLGLSRKVVQGFSPRLRELVGYGIYNGLIGHIDKKNPVDLLGAETENTMVWDI